MSPAWKTVTAAGPNTVSFATVAVTITVTRSGAPLTSAAVSHAGNTGSFGPQSPVDANGQVVFQTLPGTNSFTAWSGSIYSTATFQVTGLTSATITLP